MGWITRKDVEGRRGLNYFSLSSADCRGELVAVVVAIEVVLVGCVVTRFSSSGSSPDASLWVLVSSASGAGR